MILTGHKVYWYINIGDMHLHKVPITDVLPLVDDTSRGNSIFVIKQLLTQPFGRYDNLWSAENKYEPRPSALVHMCFLCSIKHHIDLHGCAIIDLMIVALMFLISAHSIIVLICNNIIAYIKTINDHQPLLSINDVIISWSARLIFVISTSAFGLWSICVNIFAPY